MLENSYCFSLSQQASRAESSVIPFTNWQQFLAIQLKCGKVVSIVIAHSLK